MPIYEYRCQECGVQLEKLQRISDDPLVDCPACEKPGLKRLISAAGFRLKGSGWYETDFKSGQKRNLADSEGAGKKDKEAKTGAESKSEGAKADSGKDAGKASPAKSGSAASSADAA